jgi:hypothetical protein
MMIALMMDAVSTSETAFSIYLPTRLNNPEENHLHIHRPENPKSPEISSFLSLRVCSYILI